jgi:uncharacterized protein YjbI with pentapeptide repeats
VGEGTRQIFLNIINNFTSVALYEKCGGFMSEALIGVIIGGIFGFLGALVSILTNTWLDFRRAQRERNREVRLRLVGERIQTTEVIDFIREHTRRKWPRFWEWTRADLSRARLTEIDLRGENLLQVEFFRADLSYADLDYANLTACDLSKANLAYADLTGARLRRARLGYANLRNATLNHADLSGAKLANADLGNANLSGADLTGADLTRANLSGANLENAKVSKEQLAKAVFLDESALSEGEQHRD